MNWNTKQLLHDCLESIDTHKGLLHLQIIAVDNASSDGSQTLVSDLFPNVELVANAENVGFAKANNQAFPICRADNIMLLNSDTIVLEGALQQLLVFINTHQDAGAVGPRVVHPHMRLRVMSCGYQPSLRTLFNQYSGLSSLFPTLHLFRGVNLLLGRHDDRVREVEWISGACLLTRRQVIDAVGGLDEQWFMYAEDMEWCSRIQRAGWKLYSVPEATIEHLVGASSKKNKATSTMWIRSTREYFQRREGRSALKTFLYDLIMTTGLASRSALYWARGVIDHSKRDVWWSESSEFFVYARAAASEMFCMSR